MVFYQVSLKRKDSSSNFWGLFHSEDYQGGPVFWSSQPPLSVLSALLSCSQVVLGSGSVVTEGPVRSCERSCRTGALHGVDRGSRQLSGLQIFAKLAWCSLCTTLLAGSAGFRLGCCCRTSLVTRGVVSIWGVL